MENEELCLKLLASETELEIIDVLSKSGYWKDETAWVNFGDKENNYAVVGNQKEDPVDALVEKIVNSVDAVLTKECLIRRIDPESQEAPQSIAEAVELFFGVKNGNLANSDAINRTKLAENIGLIATGRKSKPNYIIFDKGEGQTPKNMPKTFLAINESNKQKIHFVQGKHCQGGTAVLRFCGEKNFQLIISKRNQDIINDNDESYSEWGFTLIRKEIPISGWKNPVYTYLAPNKRILSFQSRQIQIPMKNKGTQEIAPLKMGTIIKLYEYEMTGVKTNILFDLYNQISLLLPRIGIPVRFYERRDYRGHSLETTLAGLGVRLEDDKRDNLEPGFPAPIDFSVENEKFKALIYAFQKDKSAKYKRGEGIIFTINGQSHGSISENFFLGNVGMSYIKDSLLVIVNCDEISKVAEDKLFLTSRDRLSKGDLLNAIKEQLRSEIKNHPGLRELRERRRREAVDTALTNSRPLQEVINDVINKSPGLYSLFKLGKDIRNPFKSRLVGEEKDFIGKAHPTKFTLASGHEKKHCHIGYRFRVQFETDVENEYFSRNRYPGNYKLYINGELYSSNLYVLNLWNGVGTLNVTLLPSVNIGDKLHGKLIVNDETLINPFENEFERIVDSEINNSGGSGGTRKPPIGNGSGSRKEDDLLSLPQITEVRENNWNKFGFDRFSTLKVINSGEKQYDFFINMDNIYLRTELKKTKEFEQSKLIEARFKYAVVLLGLTILKDQEQFGGEDENEFQSIEDIVYKISRSIAPVLLPMIDVLGDLTLENDLVINGV